MFRNRAAEKCRPNTIVLPLVIVLVKREKNESVLIVEVLVLQQWLEPEIEPRRGEVHICVVTVVDHIRCYEDPLWDHTRVHVCCEVIEIADISSARWVGCDRIIDDQRVVLAYVIGVIGCTGGDVVDRLETCLLSVARTSRREKTHSKPGKPSEGIFS